MIKYVLDHMPNDEDIQTLDQHYTGLRQLTIALWGYTLDQYHTGLRQVDNSSMGTHTRPIPH